MDKNQGYAILKAVMLENGRGFALGEHPTAPSPYVTMTIRASGSMSGDTMEMIWPLWRKTSQNGYRTTSECIM